MGRPDFDPAADDEPLYSVPDMGSEYLYASGDRPERLTEGFLGDQMNGEILEVRGSNGEGD